jgi:hypothetical protein
VTNAKKKKTTLRHLALHFWRWLWHKELLLNTFIMFLSFLTVSFLYGHWLWPLRRVKEGITFSPPCYQESWLKLSLSLLLSLPRKHSPVCCVALCPAPCSPLSFTVLIISSDHFFWCRSYAILYHVLNQGFMHRSFLSPPSLARWELFLIHLWFSPPLALSEK